MTKTDWGCILAGLGTGVITAKLGWFDWLPLWLQFALALIVVGLFLILKDKHD